VDGLSQLLKPTCRLATVTGISGICFAQDTERVWADLVGRIDHTVTWSELPVDKAECLSRTDIFY